MFFLISSSPNPEKLYLILVAEISTLASFLIGLSVPFK